MTERVVVDLAAGLRLFAVLSVSKKSIIAIVIGIITVCAYGIYISLAVFMYVHVLQSARQFFVVRRNVSITAFWTSAAKLELNSLCMAVNAKKSACVLDLDTKILVPA